jgi:hypothetical protein
MSGDKSILYWTEEDFRKAGLLKRSALAGAAHPFLEPCGGSFLGSRFINGQIFEWSESHKWDLDEEDGQLFLYCIRCQQTHRLEKDRAIVQDTTTSGRS